MAGKANEAGVDSTLDPKVEASITAAQESRPEGDLSIKPIYKNFKVEPKDDEKDDKNFPHSLHAAFQVFVMTGNISCAKRMVDCVESYLKYVSSDPDGKSQSDAGRAVICWLCGHCAISKDTNKCACASCGSPSQTNFIDVVQPDGSIIPWLQPKSENNSESMNSQDQDATNSAQEALTNLQLGKEGSTGVAKKLQPNSKCPCGSSKKVKKCPCGLWKASQMG